MGVGQKSGSTRWKPEVLVILGMNDPILRVIHQVWLILHYRTIGCRSIQLNELKTPIRNRVPRQFCCDVQLFMAWFVQTATGRPCLWVLVTSKLRGKLWIYMDFKQTSIFTPSPWGQFSKDHQPFSKDHQAKYNQRNYVIHRACVKLLTSCVRVWALLPQGGHLGLIENDRETFKAIPLLS